MLIQASIVLIHVSSVPILVSNVQKNANSC